MTRPISAILICRRRNNHVRDIGRPLHDVSVKTPRDMPGDMAVEGPDAGIVLFPLEDLIRERKWNCVSEYLLA